MDIDELKDLLDEMQNQGNVETMELVLRNAEEKDSKRLAELDKECFHQPYSLGTFEHDIKYGDNITIVIAEMAKEIVGYVEIQVVLDECEIQRVAVDPDFRGKYIASVMMDSIVHLTESLGIQSFNLEVRAGNEPAIKLYEKFGFKEVGIRKNYYGDEDAVLMLRIGDPSEFDPDHVS